MGYAYLHGLSFVLKGFLMNDHLSGVERMVSSGETIRSTPRNKKFHTDEANSFKLTKQGVPCRRNFPFQ